MATSSFGPKLWGQQLVQEKSCPPPAYGMSQEKEDDSAALAAGLAAAKALLSKGGVRVVLTRESCGGPSSVVEQGVLSLMASDLKFVAKKPKPRFSTTYISNILGVELHESSADTANTCRILLKEGAAGSSFSFSCMDASDSLSSSDVTKFVSLEIRGKVGGLEEKTAAGLAYQTKPIAPIPGVRRATNFTELLQPLDLVDKYGAAFDASRIPFENLSVVTGDDLAELVGVTDRLDQINIKAQIKRNFPCCCNGGRSQSGSGLESASRAMESVVNVVGTLAGL